MPYYTVICTARRNLCNKPIVVTCLMKATTGDEAEKVIRKCFEITDSWRYSDVVAYAFPQSWPGHSRIFDPLPMPVASA